MAVCDPVPLHAVPGVQVRRWVQEQVGALKAARAKLREDAADADALHEFRKQSRRVAAAVQMCEPYLTPVAYLDAITLASRLPKGLGACRDADVLSKRMQTLGKGKPRRLQKDLRASVPAPGKRDRAQRVRKATQRAAPKQLRKPLDALLGTMRPTTADPLAILRARLRERSLGIDATAPIHTLHALRQEFKNYRYALEATKPTPHSAAATVASQAGKLTDILGRIIGAHVLAEATTDAGPGAARVLRAAAKSNDDDARADLAEAWTGSATLALRQSFLEAAP